MKNNIIRLHAFKMAIILLVAIGLASCATSYGAKKCNGTRGQRVPMGIM